MYGSVLRLISPCLAGSPPTTLGLGCWLQVKELSWQAFYLALASHDDLTAARAADALGAANTFTENYKEADHWLTVGEAILDRINARESLIGSWLLNDRGNLYYDRGEFAASEAALRGAVALKRRILGERHPDVSTSLSNLAQTLQQMNRLEDAYGIVQSAIEGFEKYGDHESLTLAVDLTVEGEIELETSRLSEAEISLKRAIAIEESSPESQATALAVTLTDYSKLLLKRGQPAAAIPILLRAQSLLEKSDLSDKTIVGETTLALAEALGESGVDRAGAQRLAAESCKTYSRANFTRKTAQILSWFNRVFRPSGARPATSCEDIGG